MIEHNKTFSFKFETYFIFALTLKLWKFLYILYKIGVKFFKNGLVYSYSRPM